MSIHLEEFLPSQQKQVKDFILNTWKEFGYFYIRKYDFDLDNPDEFYIKKGGMFFVLLDEDQIIGTIGIINQGAGLAELKRFYVDINYRGKGYGTKIFEKALEFCKNNGFKKIEFETGKAFKQGHEFYKKQGFKTVKEDKESFYMEKVCK